MKKTFLLLASGFILSLIVLSGCNFSVGTNKDLKTGLSTTYNGFRVSEVFLGNMEKQHLSSNKIPLNSTFLIIATGVENYTLKDGKAYPGCEITVKDKAGKLMGHVDDVMAEISKKGLVPEMANTLSARATLSSPFEKGKTYNVAVRFFDKQNEKNKINADVDVVLLYVTCKQANSHFSPIKFC